MVKVGGKGRWKKAGSFEYQGEGRTESAFRMIYEKAATRITFSVREEPGTDLADSFASLRKYIRSSPSLVQLPNELLSSHPATVGPETDALYLVKLAEGTKTLPIVASRTDSVLLESIESALLNLVELTQERFSGDATIIRVCTACGKRVVLDFDGKLRLWEAGLRDVHFSCPNPLSRTSHTHTSVQRVSRDDVEKMRKRS